MRDDRRDRPGRNPLGAALVVAVLGVASTLPHDGASDGAVVVSRAPAKPCEGVAPQHRDACLRVARALLER